MAYGLVADFPLGQEGSPDRELFNAVVAGEPFRNPGGQLAATAKFRRDDLAAGIELHELESIGSLIDIYNSFAEAGDWNMEPIRDRDEVLRVAHDHVSQWLESQRRSEPGRADLEPLFIVALRNVLEGFLQSDVMQRHAAD